MSQIYEIYKPLRNKMRVLNLQQSLEDVWAYSEHLLGGRPIPEVIVGGQRVRIRDYVYPWDLSIVARELVLNASPRATKRFSSWSELASVINLLRGVENSISETIVDGDGVLAEMHRIAHQQFPWQRPRDARFLMRYLKIFGATTVERVLVSETGLTMRELYFMGLAVVGHLLKHPGISSRQDYSQFGINADKASTFFQKMSIDIQTLRDRTRQTQRYDGSWEYTWNPLEATPFVQLDENCPERLHCPIPELLFRRISQGIFYDLIKAVEFNNAYGHSYQAYVGAVIRETFEKDIYCLIEEAEYVVGKNVKHGADWILTDRTATLFFECKTKRLIHAAKSVTSGEAIDREIGTLASAVVQLYKNIVDALAGRTQWKPDGRRVFPFVVTLEDWYLFSPHIRALLRSKIEMGLDEAQVDRAVLTEMPFTVASIGEFERVARTISKVGIERFFDLKTSDTYALWMLEPFSQSCFPEEWRETARGIFVKEWENLFPEIIGAEYRASLQESSQLVTSAAN